MSTREIINIFANTQMCANKMYTIEQYTSARKTLWDDTVRMSRNATFLLERGYMDYHSDRFTDCSLIVYDRHGKVAALFAAADVKTGDKYTIVAHPGLTYGGFVLPMETNATAMLDIMDGVADFYRRQGRDKMIYKSIPHIYHRFPAEEDIYAIFRSGGRLSECNISSALLLDGNVNFDQNTRRNIAKACKVGVSMHESQSFAIFHEMLTETLAQRHDAKPVHSLAELELLASRFSKNIRLYAAYMPDGAMAAGTIVFCCGQVAHAQYIATSHDGRNCGALAALFDWLIKELKSEFTILDLGTSNECHGQILNPGLIRQKAGLGARGIAYNIYEIDL